MPGSSSAAATVAVVDPSSPADKITAQWRTPSARPTRRERTRYISVADSSSATSRSTSAKRRLFADESRALSTSSRTSCNMVRAFASSALARSWVLTRVRTSWARYGFSTQSSAAGGTNETPSSSGRAASMIRRSAYLASFLRRGNSAISSAFSPSTSKTSGVRHASACSIDRGGYAALASIPCSERSHVSTPADRRSPSATTTRPLPTVEQCLESVPLDVSTAQHRDRRSARHDNAFEQRGDSDRAAWLRNELEPVHKVTNRANRRAIGDGDDFVDV